MGHWEDTYGAACEVWELETFWCPGAAPFWTLPPNA